MKKRSLIAGILVLLAGLPQARAYYGRNSAEAELRFQARVEVRLSGNPTAQSLNSSGRKARQLVDNQVQHLMGTFQSESFVREFGYRGVLGENYQIVFHKVEPAAEAGRRILTYDFRGTVVFDKNAFRSDRIRRPIPIKLPFAPDRIYQRILSQWGMDRGILHCTDEHYNSEGDFWYFWDPDSRSCPLRGDTRLVLRTSGELRMIPNTRLSYPEYDRLYGDNGNRGALDIAVFIGYIRDVNQYRWPNRQDEAYAEFRKLDSDLLKRGFTLTTPIGQRGGFRRYRDGRVVPGINFVRQYQKQVRMGGKDQLVRIQVLLADTDINSNDATFHSFLIPALAQADILVYDGHSGLGGNLDLKSLSGVRMNPNKYQIFFFNGCSSYPYFNGMFFDRKGGSRNLEVVTSGLPTLSTTGEPNIMAFLDGFVDLRTLSYQKIMDTLEDSNGREGSYLTGVNGDEDNRFHR